MNIQTMLREIRVLVPLEMDVPILLKNVPIFDEINIKG